MEKSFNGQIYEKLSINGLIIFGIHSLGSNGKKCTFERLVKKCFTLFPQVFSFAEYPELPDSRKLDRPLRTLRKRKLITGNPKTIFSLTKQGRQLALEIAKSLSQKKLL